MQVGLFGVAGIDIQAERAPLTFCDFLLSLACLI